jgi:lysophospholipase L1-like esterase
VALLTVTAHFVVSTGQSPAAGADWRVGDCDADALRVLVIGDHTATGVASGRLPGAPDGLASFRQHLVGATADTKLCFVGPRVRRHFEPAAAPTSAGGARVKRSNHWTAPYAGSWSLTAEELVATGLLASWVKHVRPHLVVLSVGTNDLGRAVMDLIDQDAAAARTTRREETDHIDGPLDAAPDTSAGDTAEILSYIARTIAAAAHVALDSMARVLGHPGGVVVVGVLPADPARHPHEPFSTEVNSLVRAMLASTASERGWYAHVTPPQFVPVDHTVQPGGLVPNAEGEVVVAEALLAALQPIAHSVAELHRHSLSLQQQFFLWPRPLPSARALLIGFGTSACTLGLCVGLALVHRRLSARVHAAKARMASTHTDRAQQVRMARHLLAAKQQTRTGSSRLEEPAARLTPT